jgi:methionine biosynthesis protein MetW
MSARCTEVILESHRLLLEIVAGLPRGNGGERRLLDVGCWDGILTQQLARSIGARAYGLEIFEEPAALARGRGVEVVVQDVETAPFPWPDQSMDVVVCNQVLEHLKNVWRPMSEIFRVLKVGGHCVIGVPNLASLHNRLLLALGRQPTAIRTFGPHVRGFTLRELKDFLEHGGGLRVVRVAGAGLYPLPVSWSRLPNRIWPGAGAVAMAVGCKVRAMDPPWLDWVRGEQAGGVQTFYEA